MPTRIQLPASALSLFMQVLMLRDFQEMKDRLDLMSKLSLNLFLIDVAEFLEESSPRELPVPLLSKIQQQMQDLSALLGDALEMEVFTPAELRVVVSLVLRRTQKDGPDSRRIGQTAPAIITMLRDLGLATASDCSIHHAYLIATNLTPSHRGEWH